MEHIQHQLRQLNSLSRELEELYRQAARKLGVSDSTLCILYALLELGDGCLLGDIILQCSLRKQTVNSALRKLEQAGILYLEQDRGKRKRIRLTDRGRECIRQTALRLYEAETSVLSSWSAADLDAYPRLMKQYNDAFRAQLETLEGNTDETTGGFL